MSVKNITSLAGVVTVQPAAAVKQLPKPTAQKTGFFSGLFESKKVEQLATNPLAKPQAQAPEAPKVEAPKVEPKKAFDPASMVLVQNLLKDTSRSTFDKLKSLLPIPESLTSIVNMFLGKGTKANVKVGLENGAVNLTADVKMPALGIQGTAVLSLPMTAQPASDITEFHPLIVDKLSKALNPLLSDEQQVKELIKLISTLPSEVLKFHWSNGSANIIITLPNGASINLNLTLPTSEESAETPDIVRTLLKTILKENYAGIETFLSRDMIFNWDGSTSRFEIRFPQQLALHIEKISSIDIANPILSKLVAAVGKDSTIIIPPNIRGTVDFKNPSIQFDKGTTFVVKNAPIPDITIDRISYDPTAEKMFLTLKTSWLVIPDALLRNLEIDLKDSPKKAPKKDAIEKPNIVKYAFVPVETKDVARPETAHLVADKPKISVFESLKKMIKIPEALEPLIGIFFADQTKLDVNVGIEDNLTVSVNNLNIPKLGLVGKASLSIPAVPANTEEQAPVELHPQIEHLIETLIGQPNSEEEFALMGNLIDLALTMPNQNMHMRWEGGIGMAQLVVTLPGGMLLTLDLDVQKIQGKNDPLMAQFLEILDNELVVPKDESPLYYRQTRLLKVLDTVAADDPRRAQILEVLQTNTDKDILRSELAKIIEKDILRTKLTEILGSQFAADIEPLLSQSFTFNWDGKTKQFSIKFLKEQKLHIKSLKFKKAEGFFGPVINFFRNIVEGLMKNSMITLPKEIRGSVDLANAKINFYKGTSFYIGMKRAGLRLVSFARENWIDIGIKCIGGHMIDIDRTKSDLDKSRTRIAIVDRAPKKPRIAAHAGRVRNHD